jgi:hypothetical protein
MERESFDTALANEMILVSGADETQRLILRMGVCPLPAFEAFTI